MADERADNRQRSSNSVTAIADRRAGRKDGAKALQAVPASGTPPVVQKYKASDFIVPAHDEHGHSIPYSFRGDKRYADIISKLIWARVLPYRTAADFHRDAMHKHLRFLDQLEPSLIHDDLLRVEAVNRVTRELESIDEFASAIDKMEAAVQKLVSKPALRGTAVRIVYDLRKDLGKFRDTNVRKHFAEEIQNRFGHLFSGALGMGDAVDFMAAVEDEAEDALHEEWGEVRKLEDEAVDYEDQVAGEEGEGE